MYLQKLKIKTTVLIGFLILITFPLVIFAAGASGSEVSLLNYLNVSTIKELLEAILNILIIIATPIIIFFIIYSGYLYVTARGNPEQIKTATTAFTYAVIGGVIIIGAVAIGAIIGNMVADFKA